MTDPIERRDVLDTVTEFRNGIFHEKNLTRDNEHDWEAAYEMHTLYDRLYKLPRAKDPIGYQRVIPVKGWSEEVHICSKCKKIVPFIDWCQPFCSGCGVRFRNYHKWVAKERKESKQ